MSAMTSLEDSMIITGDLAVLEDSRGDGALRTCVRGIDTGQILVLE